MQGGPTNKKIRIVPVQVAEPFAQHRLHTFNNHPQDCFLKFTHMQLLMGAVKVFDLSYNLYNLRDFKYRVRHPSVCQGRLSNGMADRNL